ncbi:MAG: SHOCT domain-containing protein [Actinomycetota bacterium]
MFGKKIKDPVAGQAQVLGVGLPTESQGRVMRISLQLLIEAPGIEPQQVKANKMVKRKNIPQAGMVLPVTVDRRDPSRWEIDWDAAPTRQDIMDAQAQAIIEGGGIGAAASAAGQAAPAGGDDRIAKLESLAKLHASGALSDEEFEAEKARVLGS